MGWQLWLGIFGVPSSLLGRRLVAGRFPTGTVRGCWEEQVKLIALHLYKEEEPGVQEGPFLSCRCWQCEVAWRISWKGKKNPIDYSKLAEQEHHQQRSKLGTISLPTARPKHGKFEY